MERQVVQVVGSVVERALREKETELDNELFTLNNQDIAAEDDIDALRQRRLVQLKQQRQKMTHYRENNHGTYKELMEEREFFQVCKDSQFVLCHFYRPATRLCLELDEKLDLLAQKHLHIRVVKINVERSPFLCERLKIFVIPSMMLIKDGQAVHTMIGFEELGGTESFELCDLEAALALHEFLQMKSRM
ncbi:MAG: uncharacterized protein KVP18_000471 [Porospora cf. gigantea A]|uniref:uncharacterized protein n=1 Tax=Porospora cf. gigantea A TaxID=2853593 RepID=UPI00355989E8|nr:MAG: hypothetical protein KVP18_000471 [Porospora cf. gigantea A]